MYIPLVFCDICARTIEGPVYSRDDLQICKMCDDDLEMVAVKKVRSMDNLPWPLLVAGFLGNATLIWLNPTWPLLDGVCSVVIFLAIAEALLKLNGGFRNSK